MHKNDVKSTCSLKPAWTALTAATPASCRLPSASPPLDHPLGTELRGSAPAGTCLFPWLVLTTPMKVLDATRAAQSSS